MYSLQKKQYSPDAAEAEAPATAEATEVIIPDANVNGGDAPAGDAATGPTGDNLDELLEEGDVNKPIFSFSPQQKPAAEVKPEDVTTENISALRQENSQLQARIKELEAVEPLLKNPFTASLIEFVNSGSSDIDGFFKTLTGAGVDPKKMTPIELYEWELKNVKAVKRPGEWNEAAISEALTEFGYKTASEQAALTDHTFERLEKEYHDGLSKVKDKLKSTKQEAAPLWGPEEQKEWDTRQGAYSAMVEGTVGKKYFDIDFTPQMSEEMKGAAARIIATDENGFLDTELTFQLCFLAMYLDKYDRVKINIGHAKKIPKAAGVKSAEDQPGSASGSGAQGSNNYDAWKKNKKTGG